ncbi:MAG TPA: hypothetical protein VFI38_10765 [Candidatus Acidoferrum sp.]|nr:hypothetical protein [Candidatus Acidoferrum sp.]
MISRSDGRNFHLLLADRPLPYPMENAEGPTRTISVCFWYVYGAEKLEPKSTVVLFEGTLSAKAAMFRQIECIADMLADELQRSEALAGFYNLQADEILEVAY